MIFVTFALLVSGPVHKESELMMNHSDGHDHIGEDSQRRDSGQESQNEAEAAKEFRTYGQKSEQHRNVHDPGEEAHGARESVAAEPAQHLLRAVGEENRAQHQPYQREQEIVWSGKYLAQRVPPERPAVAAPLGYNGCVL